MASVFGRPVLSRRMQVIHEGAALPPEVRGSVLSPGMFDGVHVGHQEVIRRAVATARALGTRSVVITFDRHPASVVRPADAVRLLTDLHQRAARIEQLGVDVLYVARFDEERSLEDSAAFVDELVRDFAPRAVVVGEDFHFGHRRRGDLPLLETAGNAAGFKVEGVGWVSLEGEGRVSSTRIRELLGQGDVGGPPPRGAVVVGGGDVRPSLTAGESHGRSLGVIVEGLPAGLAVTVEDVSAELARRRLGFGRGPRQRFERDELTLVGGVRHGRTLGGPVLIEIPNPEWPRWEQEMSPAPGSPSKRLTAPRPGHADLAAMQKYGFDDARDALERASARETAARVAAGTLAKLLLRELGVEVLSHVVAMAGVEAPQGSRPEPADLDAVDASPVRCFDPGATEAMVTAIKAAAKEGDSVGGVVEVVAHGVPAG